MTGGFKYSDIFEDHMKIAREQFIKEHGREPSWDELIAKLAELNYYFFS